MAGNLALIGVALLLLFGGAEFLVGGSASLARRAGLSRLTVGLTVVAFGTSSPELVVSIKSALSQQGDISVGNAVGSNVFNIGVILGCAALLCPIPVHGQVIRIDAPIALGAALLLPLVLLDHTATRLEGALLLAGLVAYAWLNVVLARRQVKAGAGALGEAPASQTGRHWAMDALLIAGGLVALVLGANLLVDQAVDLARAFGVGEAVIGLTIVAAGTSMPELATSVVAAFRKQPDIAVGNAIGSNIFNILGVLGLAALASPLRAPGVSTLDLATMIAFTVLVIPLLYTGRLLHRLEGVVLLLLYGAYIIARWPR